jgi:hypothetical protein
MKTYEWRYSSTILDLGTRWRRVVSFTPMPLYHRGKSPRYPLDRRLGAPQSQFRRCGGEKISCHCQQSNPGRQPVARRLSTELSLLQNYLFEYGIKHLFFKFPVSYVIEQLFFLIFCSVRNKTTFFSNVLLSMEETNCF